MISFREFIFESKSDILFSFEFQDEKTTFKSSTKKGIYCQVLDWLYNNGYDFEREKNQNKILDKTKVEEIITNTNYRIDHYYNISNSNNFIKILSPGTSYLDNGGLISNILKDLGCINLKFETPSQPSVEKIKTNNSMNKMTFINAAQLILKENDNRPMSANEIWDIIDDRNLVETKGTTPWLTLNAGMLSYSDNSNVKYKQKKKIFTIVETNPAKFKLISNEVQDVSDEISEVWEKPRFWIYAPGDSSKKWEDFYNDGVMGLGWDDLGDFDKLGDREEITLKLKENRPNVTSAQTNSSLAIYEFRDVIKPGDVIIAKQGTSAYLGYGIVISDNYFDEKADELKNRRKVDWKKKGVFPAGGSIVQKTLTDITKYPDYVKKLINLIGIEEFMDEDDFSDIEQIKPFGKFPQPFDVESELKRAQAQSEEDVLSFKNFRATEPEYERPDELLVFNLYVKNPFSQAICVLGESGAGKSTTVDNILQSSSHVYQYIIPSASTTGLLSQFSPSAGAAGGYIPSRLGQMIEMAYKNKDKNYTAVFDECHKTSIIEMINDELLQAISKNRNKGVRFISLDDDTRRLFPSAQEDSRGNVLIPDNFGFIFISSNARVIAGNPDFFNRVDLVELTVEDRKLKNIEELNQKRVTSSEDKRELVNKIVSGGQ